MALTRVCAVDEVPEGEVRRFEVGERLVAVVNLGTVGLRAVSAICSHAKYFLDEGEVDIDEGSIECPKHGSTFDLDTGRPRSLPATRPIETYKVKVDNDDVLIEVNDG